MREEGRKDVKDCTGPSPSTEFCSGRSRQHHYAFRDSSCADDPPEVKCPTGTTARCVCFPTSPTGIVSHPPSHAQLRCADASAAVSLK